MPKRYAGEFRRGICERLVAGERISNSQKKPLSQLRRCICVEVLGRVSPGFVGDTAIVGNSGSLLGELESSPLTFGEDRCLSPCRDQVESHRAFPEAPQN